MYGSECGLACVDREPFPPSPLIPLRDDDSSVKGTAISALGGLGDTRALQPLMEVLADRENTSGEQRGAAATALHLLKDADRSPPSLMP